MIYKFLLFAVYFSVTQLSFGQKNYLPARVVDLQGDTLAGFINYRNWGRSPDRIQFRRELDGETTSFTPLEISAFSVKDEVYEGAIVDIEVSPHNSAELTEDPELKLATDTAFLQTMIRGPRSLYYLKTRNGKEHFYIKQRGSFELLKYKKYREDRGTGNSTAEIKLYINQLSRYFENCNTIYPTLRDSEYEKKRLEEVFVQYYECTGETIEFQKTTEPLKVSIGLLAGGALTSLTFESSSFPYLVNAGYNSPFGFLGGVCFDLILPRTRDQWSINNEIFFTSYDVDGRYEDFRNENEFTITTTQIGLAYVKINNMVRFKYPIGNASIFFNGGISNGFAISETNVLRRESKIFSQERDEEGNALEEFRSNEQGFLFGVGGKLQKYSVEFRYERGNGMSNFSTLDSSTNRLYLLVGFLFNN